MFFAIDIGNTNITIGSFKDDKVEFVARMATDRSKTKDQYAVELKTLFELYKTNINFCQGVAISSVVPELSEVVKKAAYMVTGCTPLVLGPGIKSGINIKIDNPAQLGADLLAGCVGAKKLYKLPCIVIDLGTASKVSIIDKEGAFRGCAIAPGINISLDALSARTSQLPHISLKTPDHAIGRNTNDSMQSGTVFGFASMIDGLCEKFEEELNEGPCSIVATGGLAKDLVKSCKHDVTYNGELILYGLKIIYDMNK